MIDHIIDFGAAIIFAILPLVDSSVRASWSRWLFFTISGLMLVIASCGWALDSHLLELSKHGQSVYWHYLHVIRGFILGCIFALIVSGNIKGKKIVIDETVV